MVPRSYSARRGLAILVEAEESDGGIGPANPRIGSMGRQSPEPRSRSTFGGGPVRESRTLGSAREAGIIWSCTATEWNPDTRRLRHATHPCCVRDPSDYGEVAWRSEGTRRLPRKPSLSRYFRDARIARGLSVVDLAERVGVSQTSIYFREGGGCGRGKPTWQHCAGPEAADRAKEIAAGWSRHPPHTLPSDFPRAKRRTVGVNFSKIADRPFSLTSLAAISGENHARRRWFCSGHTSSTRRTRSKKTATRHVTTFPTGNRLL